LVVHDTLETLFHELWDLKVPHLRTNVPSVDEEKRASLTPDCVKQACTVRSVAVGHEYLLVNLRCRTFAPDVSV
jgi:hypothetical protein